MCLSEWCKPVISDLHCKGMAFYKNLLEKLDQKLGKLHIIFAKIGKIISLHSIFYPLYQSFTFIKKLFSSISRF